MTESSNGVANEAASDVGIAGRALITGASAGLGEEYAKRLAKRCESLLLVARRGDRLQKLAAELGGDCDVDILVADITTTEGQGRVVEAIRQGPPLRYLINNAGFSTLGRYVTSVLDKELEMVRLHQDAVLVLTRAALPAMQDAGAGHIVNVASIAALSTMPGVAVYGASKAFLVSFSRSLAVELSDSGVSIQCLCPGYTRTEIHSRETFKGFDVDRVPEALWMEASEVVAESIAAMDAEDPPVIVVNGEHNKELVRAAISELMEAV